MQNRLPAVLQQVSDVIAANVDSGSHTNGKLVRGFEQRFADRLGVPDVVGMTSGSATLRAAFELLELPPGSEVIVPAYTFVMSAYSISDAFAVDAGSYRSGLVPVFVDVDPRTYTIAPDAAAAAISERTRAILTVHLLGQMADMRPILDLAAAHGLYVVEDAAQAHGASYRDPVTGAQLAAGGAGHLGCFSLSDVKNMGTMGSDAGALAITESALARRSDLADAARGWRNTGRHGRHRFEHQTWGVRARMDEYSAAECLAELDELDQWNARRRAIAARYTEALRGSELQPPHSAEGREHVFFGYVVKAPDTQARDELLRRMRVAGIAVADVYTVVADQPVYRYGMLPSRALSLEVSQALAELLVAVPCYPELTEEEVERIEAVLASS